MKRLLALLLVGLLLLCGCAIGAPGDAYVDQEVTNDEPPEEEEEEFHGPISFSEAMKEGNGSSYDGIEITPPKIVAIPKQEGITKEQRAFFFDFVQTYRVDAMPDFENTAKLKAEDLKWLVANLCRDELSKDENGRTTIPGSVLSRVAAEYFGISKPEFEQDQSLGDGSFLSIPMVELIYYKEEQIDGKAIITARVFDHCPDEYNYAEDPENEEVYYYGDRDYSEKSLEIFARKKKDQCSFYQATKNMILEGYWTEASYGKIYIEFQYEADADQNPIKFISCKKIIL